MIFQNREFAAILTAGILTTSIIFYTTTLDSSEIKIDGGLLAIDSRYYTNEFLVADLDLDQAIFDEWNRFSKYWPANRISGDSSTMEGLFRLASGEKVFVVNTGTGELLFLPLDKSVSLIYRGDDGRDLLDLLKKQQATPNQ